VLLSEPLPVDPDPLVLLSEPLPVDPALVLPPEVVSAEPVVVAPPELDPSSPHAPTSTQTTTAVVIALRVIVDLRRKRTRRGDAPSR